MMKSQKKKKKRFFVVGFCVLCMCFVYLFVLRNHAWQIYWSSSFAYIWCYIKDGNMFIYKQKDSYIQINLQKAKPFTIFFISYTLLHFLFNSFWLLCKWKTCCLLLIKVEPSFKSSEAKDPPWKQKTAQVPSVHFLCNVITKMWREGITRSCFCSVPALTEALSLQIMALLYILDPVITSFCEKPTVLSSPLRTPVVL